MANSSVVDWAIANASKLNLEATKVTWVDEWLPGYFDYQVKIIIDGQVYLGRGIDSNEDIAFAKSVAEGLERAAASALKDPWATAAYPDFHGARERAYFELLGIDRVLCHHYCRRRSRVLEQEVVGTSFPARRFFEMLRKNRLEITLLELTPSSDAKVAGAFVSSIDPESPIKGFVKGYGVEKTLEEAVSHAVIECMRNSVAVFLGGAKPDPGELSCRPTNPRWHFWMAQTAESMKYFRANFISKPETKSQLAPENISINNTGFTRINTLDSIFPDVPLVFVQAYSDKLIRPQFGEFTADEHTVKRLEIFNGGPVNVDATVPHFYG